MTYKTNREPSVRVPQMVKRKLEVHGCVMKATGAALQLDHTLPSIHYMCRYVLGFL
jgi:hypothetical protein